MTIRDFLANIGGRNKRVSNERGASAAATKKVKTDKISLQLKNNKNVNEQSQNFSGSFQATSSSVVLQTINTNKNEVISKNKLIVFEEHESDQMVVETEDKDGYDSEKQNDSARENENEV